MFCNEILLEISCQLMDVRRKNVFHVNILNVFQSGN